MWLIELFRAVEQALGKREIIAEDLGYMSETVRQLVKAGQRLPVLHEGAGICVLLTPATPEVPATICHNGTR